MKKILLSLFMITILVMSLSSWFVWNQYQNFLNSPLSQSSIKGGYKMIENDLPKQIVFEIKKGEGLKKISYQLEKQKIIAKPLFFTLYVRINKLSAKLKAGEYTINSYITPKQLVDLFVSGKVKQYSVTLVEGWNLKQILTHLEKVLSLKEHIANENFYKAVGVKETNPEGYFFPDTYFYTKGTSASEIIKRSYIKMKNVLLKEWQNREANLPFKTAYEALILASIVEKESGKSSERSKISGVFIRRMQKKMRLQSDPTIIYGMGDRYDGNIRKRDIREKTAYNTYQINGLPPTPIASPSQESIYAVFHPDKEDSLYFVADGKGGHVFSKTLRQHNQAVRNYLRQERLKNSR